MSAEGKPHIERSLLARPLGLLTAVLLRRPRLVLTASLVLAAASLFLTATQLGFRNNRLDLLNPESRYNKRWLNYLDEFGDQDDVVLVVEGEDQRQIVDALADLARAVLRERRHFTSVLYTNDHLRLKRKGLHYLTPRQMDQLGQFLDQIEPVLEGRWSSMNVALLVRGYNDQLQWQGAGQTEQEFAQLASSLSAMFTPTPAYQSPWNIAPAPPAANEGPQYFLNDQGTLGFLTLRLRERGGRLARGAKAIRRLNEITTDVSARHPHVQIGMTGMPILENDEMTTSRSDMTRASILSLVAVACLFIAGFGGLKHPLMTVVALVTAMAWSFGFVTLAVGHLNILSISFGVILIGLGIDFGIHYVARYLQCRQRGQPVRKALIATASRVGPGIVTGGVTTALAFSTAALTPFTGVAELGIIAGGGIVICIFGAIMLLPVLILMVEKRARRSGPVPQPIPAHLLVRPFAAAPRITLLLALAFTAVLGCFALRLRCDHNLLNLQAESLRSMALERRLLEETDQSVWYALSMAENAAEAARLKTEFLQLDCVGRVEEVATACLPANPANAGRIKAIAARVRQLPAQPPEIAISSFDRLQRELQRTVRLLRQRGDATWTNSPLFADSPSQPLHLREGPLVVLVERMLGQLQSLSADEYYRRLARYQRDLANDLLSKLTAIRDSSDPTPPCLDDLPRAIRDRFVGRSEKLLLKVYARDDIWDMDQLKQFVVALESKDPEVTGHPVQTYYASREMQRSYVHAAVYSLLAVLIVLMLDFRSLRYSLLALLPVGLGMLQLFGIMGLFDIPLNPANLIVLPLILGIGIDDGVHVIHDFRNQSGRYRVGRSTATALLITSATTIAGFGMMMFSRHQGLRSLGQVLTLGVFCCMLTSIVILPALLSLLTRRRPAAAGDVQPTEAAGGSPILLADTPGGGTATSSPADPQQRRAA